MIEAIHKAVHRTDLHFQWPLLIRQELIYFSGRGQCFGRFYRIKDHIQIRFGQDTHDLTAKGRVDVVDV